MKLKINLYSRLDRYSKPYPVTIFAGNIIPQIPLPEFPDAMLNFKSDYSKAYEYESEQKVNTRFRYPYSSNYIELGVAGKMSLYAKLNLWQRTILRFINKDLWGLSKSNLINLGILIVGIISLLIIWPSKDTPKPLIQNIGHPSGWTSNEPYPFNVIIRNYGNSTAYKVQPSNIIVFNKVVLDDSVFDSLVIDTTQSFNILPNTEQDMTFLSSLIYSEGINWGKVFLVGKLTYLNSDKELHTTKFAGWFIENRIIPELNETD